MNNCARHQKGGSTITTIIVIALLGFGSYLAFQYLPLFVEASSIQSILNRIQEAHSIDPVTSEAAAEGKVISMLQINEMNDMTDAFKVTEKNGVIEIRFKYDRELNLLYKTRPLHYDLSVRLK